MLVLHRQQYVLTKLASMISVLLLLGVLWHISGQGAPPGKSASGSPNDRLSRAAFDVANITCSQHVDTNLPVLNTNHTGAVADIKRLTADYSHISDHVKSCTFQSQKLSRHQGSRRGIVIPSAGHTMFAHSWVVVTILRETLGCSLPVEVVYNGNEELDQDLALRLEVCLCLRMKRSNADRQLLGTAPKPTPEQSSLFNCIALSPRLRFKLELVSGLPSLISRLTLDFTAKYSGSYTLQAVQDVTLVDASKISLPPHHRPMQWNQTFKLDKYKHATGYSFKAYVLAFVTSFDEALILDADNLPLLNPEPLFETAQYRQKGNTFWPDWWKKTKTNTLPFELDVDPFAYHT